jgi:DUF1009 family protein
LTKIVPSLADEEDITFGLRVAKNIADLEIGQTVIVKKGAIIAVEGIEGTDEAIRRGGELAGPDIVVAKVGRTSQDMRVDVPAVGLSTIKNLVAVKGKALCIEAQKVLFFQKEESISLAQGNNIMILAKDLSNFH